MSGDKASQVAASLDPSETHLRVETKLFDSCQNSWALWAVTYNGQSRSQANPAEDAQRIDQIGYPFIRDKATDKYNIKIPGNIAVFFKDFTAIGIWDNDRRSRNARLYRLTATDVFAEPSHSFFEFRHQAHTAR